MNRRRKLLNNYRIILFIIYLSLIVIFCYFCMQSGNNSENTSNGISIAICNLFKIQKTDQIASFIRKAVGHFGFFCIFGLVSSILYLTFIKISVFKRFLFSFLAAIIYILITEFIFQVIAIDRGPSFTDCLIDFGGFSLSSVIVIIIYLLIKLNDVKELSKNKKIKLTYTIIMGIIYLSLIILNIIFSLQDGQTSATVGKAISQTVVDVTTGGSSVDVNKTSVTVQQFLRKVIGHFGLFSLTGLFSYLFYDSIDKYNKKIWIISHFVIGISLAFISEYLCQLIILSRTPSINDVITDSLGFIFTSICLIYVEKSIYFINKNEYKIVK